MELNYIELFYITILYIPLRVPFGFKNKTDYPHICKHKK